MGLAEPASESAELGAADLGVQLPAVDRDTSKRIDDAA